MRRKNLILLTLMLASSTMLFSCGGVDAPSKVVEAYYASICSKNFDELDAKLNLHPQRVDMYKKTKDKIDEFFNKEATPEDEKALASLFSVSEIKESLNNDKKSAKVEYKLLINGKYSYPMQANLAKGDKGWQINPQDNVLNFLGLESVLMYMPSLDNTLTEKEISKFKDISASDIDYSVSIQNAVKNNLFQKIIKKSKNPIRATYKNAIVVDADEFGRYKEGLCAFRRGDFWGFMDVNGKTVIEPKFKFPENKMLDYGDKKIKFPFFSYGLCLVYNNDGWPVYINEKGKIVIDGTFMFHNGAPFVGNYANVGYVDVKPGNTYALNDPRAYITTFDCYINRNGMVQNHLGVKKANSFMLAKANIPVEGLVPFSRNGLTGFRDIEFNEVIEPAYTDVQNFSEGLAWVKKKDDYGREKWGAINRKGEVIIQHKYSKEPKSFHCGRAFIKAESQNDLIEIIDIKGNKIFDFRSASGYYQINDFVAGISGIYDINGGKILTLREAHDLKNILPRIKLFEPSYKWETEDLDPIIFTLFREDKGSGAIGSLLLNTDLNLNEEFFYNDQRFFDMDRTEDRQFFEGFRGSDGNFAIIRYRNI